ncbi:MAG: hypothetical protein JJE36_05610 [Coriobacteriia bacterium]|nr:hypothetical protein [Coriobacteriia bacterium]
MKLITRFKTALGRIKADEALLDKTEAYLKDALEHRNGRRSGVPINWRVLYMKKSFAVALSVAVLAVGGSVGGYAFYQTPQSYLSLDINPSIELGVNSFGKVVMAEAYNADGEKVLNGTDVVGSNVDEATDALITSTGANGYIAGDGSTIISLTSETDDDAMADKLESDAESGANNALEQAGYTAEVHKDRISLSLREEAIAAGITPGKLNLIHKLQSADPTATVDAYKSASVTEIIRHTQLAKGIPAASGKKSDSGSDSADMQDAKSDGADNQDENDDSDNENSTGSNSMKERTVHKKSTTASGASDDQDEATDQSDQNDDQDEATDQSDDQDNHDSMKSATDTQDRDNGDSNSHGNQDN